MKVFRRIIYWIVAFGVVSATFWFGFRPKPSQERAGEKLVPVEVAEVRVGSIEQSLELTGWIEASRIVRVSSKVSGRLESLAVVLEDGKVLPVEEGLRVRKGQELGRVDREVYLAQLAAAEAAVRAREVELADAEREKRRIMSLYEGGSVTEQAKDRAVTAVELASANLRAAEADLELAKINLRESTIVAPMDGVVTAKHVDPGNLVRIGDPIVTIADIETVKIIVPVAERYADKITEGMPAVISVDAFADRRFHAKVYSLHPVLDPQTHTLQVEIRLDNEEGLLRPGMFARVKLVLQHREKAVVIARDVVLGGKINEPYVFVVEEQDGRKVACKRIVRLGIREGGRCEVVEGLREGELLVVNGMHFLADGMQVELVRIEEIQ